jgi:hypothetical protein
MNGFRALGAVSVSAPVGICVAHAVLSRVIRYWGRRSFPPQFVALGAAAIVLIAVTWVSWSTALRYVCESRLDVFCGITYVLLTYGGFSWCYFNVLNASETSLHVHIMTSLLIEGGVSAKELSRKYSAKDMIESRIERMIALGQLMERDGCFVLRSRTLVVVGRVINGWRKILRLRLSPG